MSNYAVAYRINDRESVQNVVISAESEHEARQKAIARQPMHTVHIVSVVKR